MRRKIPPEGVLERNPPLPRSHGVTVPQPSSIAELKLLRLPRGADHPSRVMDGLEPDHGGEFSSSTATANGPCAPVALVTSMKIEIRSPAENVVVDKVPVLTVPSPSPWT